MRKYIIAALLMLVFLGAIGQTAVEDYILMIEPSGDGFSAYMSEIDQTIQALTPDLAFDGAVATVKGLKDGLREQIAAIDAQIATLQEQKASLQETGNKTLQIYSILVEKDQLIYKRILTVLSEKSGLEEHFGVDVYSVGFRPSKRNIYGTALIWVWHFGKWGR